MPIPDNQTNRTGKLLLIRAALVMVSFLTGFSACQQASLKEALTFAKYAQAGPPAPGNALQKKSPASPRFPLQTKVLTILTGISTQSFFLYEGTTMGFSYELLKLFARDQGIKLIVKVIRNPDYQLDSLNAGAGDVAIGLQPACRKALASVQYTLPVLSQNPPPRTGNASAVIFSKQWAVYRKSAGLLIRLNEWLSRRQRTRDYALIVRYYTTSSRIRQRFATLSNPLRKDIHISRYDALVQRYARQIQWDWQLLAALIYQESKFNPVARSGAGAVGLMQLKPATAREFGVPRHQLSRPECNVKAGSAYLKWLDRIWRRHINDEAEVIKFVLASYNAGIGHVQDARRLAAKYHLDPQRWEGNVETMLLQKSKVRYYRDEVVQFGYCRGKEPVNYVKNTLAYYRDYKNISAGI